MSSKPIFVPAEAQFRNFVELEPIPNEENKDYEKLMDSIVEISEENFESVIKNIIPHKDYINHIIKLIYYSMSIRPQKQSLFKDLLGRFDKEFKIKVQEDSFTNDNYQENSIEQIIKEDNVEQFTKYISSGTKNKVILKQGNSILKRLLNSSTTDVECQYMNLMAYYGSIKCFKCALLDGSLPYDNIQPFAIAGGNQEIINILEQKGVSFDNTFEVAVKYHRHEQCNWLLEHYQCEIFLLEKTIEYFNNRALHFLMRNKLHSKTKMNNILCALIRTDDLVTFKFFVKNTYILKKKSFDDLTSNAILDEIVKSNCTNITDYIIKTRLISKRSFSLNREIKRGNLGRVKFLVEKLHFNPEEEHYEDYEDILGDVYSVETRPIHVAIENHQMDIIKYLVKECHVVVRTDPDEDIDYEVNNCLCIRKSVLAEAIDSRDINIVKYLAEECHVDLEESFVVEHTDRSGSISGEFQYPIAYARENGTREIVKYIACFDASAFKKEEEDEDEIYVRSRINKKSSDDDDDDESGVEFISKTTKRPTGDQKKEIIVID